MRKPGQVNLYVLALFALFSLPFTVQAQTSSAKSSGPVSKASLASARTALSKLSNSDTLPSQLEAHALALPVHDAVMLLKEFLPKIKALSRGPIASLAGSLALMAGRYEDAGFLFLQGIEAKPELGLDAIRSYLAAGNILEAGKVLDRLQALGVNPGQEKKNKIAQSWLYLLDNKSEMAFILLRDIVTPSPETRALAEPVMREALFLLWIIASSVEFSSFSISTVGFDAQALARRLEREYPGSMEHAIVQKGLPLAPSTWILTGLFPYLPAQQSSTAGVISRGPEVVDSGAADRDKDSSATANPTRLQVGWFSRRENASAFYVTLKNKGFSVSMEEQKTQEGQIRWAVIVEAQEDWSKTQARLKDLGYESYLLP